jgi:hypothetical protein
MSEKILCGMLQSNAYDEKIAEIATKINRSCYAIIDIFNAAGRDRLRGRRRIASRRTTGQPERR